MAKEINKKIRIGKKSRNDYVAAALYSLNKSGIAIIEALGRRKGKALDVCEKLEDIADVESGSPQMLDVDGTNGLRIQVRKEGGPP